MIAMLYQMLKMLPRICGSSGAIAVINNFDDAGVCSLPFSGASMAENNRGESGVRAISLFDMPEQFSGSLSFFRKRTRAKRKQTCRPGGWARCIEAAVA